MKLIRVVINNFRGLQNIDINLSNITSLIGKNNCGKSSVLKAIEMVCSGIKPDLEEFHRENHEEKIEIEATFSHLEQWERNTPAISGLVYNNEIRLKYCAEVVGEREKPKCEISYFSFKQDEAITGWSDTWADLSPELIEIANGIGIRNATGFKSNSAKERVKQQIRLDRADLIALGEARWSDESITFGNALQQALPKVILIPAVKDAMEEMKIGKTGKSAFNEIMNKLVLPLVKAEANYQAIADAVSAFKDRIQGEDTLDGIKQINTKLSDRLQRMINAKATLRLGDPEVDTLITSNIGLRISDGEHNTPVELQGHGLQRTLIFSLLELVAENDSVINAENTRSTLLLFEEPELYLHPQMLRKLKAILSTISNTNTWQVICTTHSPVFINVADQPQSLVIMMRQRGQEIIRKQLAADPFEQTELGLIERDALRAALDFHPTVCEVFFAENVVVVEGDTEMAILKHSQNLLEYCNVDLSKAHDCTIVSCGGKWTIPAIARLLNHFGITYKIIHDMDRHGKTDDELAAVLPVHPYRANVRIAALCPPERILINNDTLEDIWGGNKSDKPYAAIKTIQRHVENATVPDLLVDLVRFAYDGFLTADVGLEAGAIVENA